MGIYGDLVINSSSRKSGVCGNSAYLVPIGWSALNGHYSSDIPCGLPAISQYRRVLPSFHYKKARRGGRVIPVPFLDSIISQTKHLEMFFSTKKHSLALEDVFKFAYYQPHRGQFLGKMLNQHKYASKSKSVKTNTISK